MPPAITSPSKAPSAPLQATRFDGNVILDAGNTITLDHGIFLTDSDLHIHAISITGKHLAYTGAGAFEISAGYGVLDFDASIGSAAAPVKYAVKLFDQGYGIYIDRSIYTAGSIDVQELNFSNVAGSRSGAFISASTGKPVALSAKGPISIEGMRVGIGGAAAITISADDGNAATHTDVLTIKAIDNNASHGVTIRGSNASVSYGGNGKSSVNHSVTLHAGRDVDIGGYKLQLGGGSAYADAHTSAAGATAKDQLTISAGNNINLSGDEVYLDAGEARAYANASDTKATVTAAANASTTLTAGHVINIGSTATTTLTSLNAGFADVSVDDHIAKQQVTATATADLSITAGHNIKIAANSVSAHAGNSVGRSAQISTGTAAISGAKATGVAHGDLSLKAGNALAVTGMFITVRGGNRVGGGESSFFHTNCGGICSLSVETGGNARVIASGKNAAASLTATGNLSLTAGAGGISLTDVTGHVSVSAG